MSTIRCDNFGPSAGGTTYSARGIAKAWVNFNGTDTIAARDSENVSSLTDNGTGDYTVNFSNATETADYAVACSGMFSGASDGQTTNVGPRRGVTAYSALFIRLQSTVASTATVNDALFVNASIHGDLA